MRQLSRDPFAREELHRETVKVRPGLGETCCWCGGYRKGGFLYRYVVVPDVGRTVPDARLFCSADCRRAYEGR